MRDIFEDIFTQQPIDPIEAARRGARAHRKRRFYHQVSVADEDAKTFSVRLDDRRIRTPASTFLTFPTRFLAEAVATEWQAQREFVDPAGMPLTRLSNTIIDGVVQACAQVAAEIVKYIGSDLLFYRADGPSGLTARQTKYWDPILAWAREAHGAHFVLAQGVTFVRQPEPSVAAMATAIPTDPWRLGAVNAITTLTGSALIALAVAAGQLSVEAAWAAAHVDEDWNLDTWGRDELALQRQASAETEMRAAAMLLACLSQETV